MIVAETGEVLEFNVRSKICKSCDEAITKGKEPNLHGRTINLDVSSKAIKPDMVVEMVGNIKHKWIDVCSNITEDDTVARLKNQL